MYIFSIVLSVNVCFIILKLLIGVDTKRGLRITNSRVEELLLDFVTWLERRWGWETMDVNNRSNIVSFKEFC